MQRLARSPALPILVGALAFSPSTAAQTTTLVGVDSRGVQAVLFSNDLSMSTAISDDGRFVAFRSEDPNLVAGDTNGGRDVFVHDRWTGTTERVSVNSSGQQGGGVPYQVTLSGDGRFVAFVSLGSNFAPGDTNLRMDVFVHDRQLHTTERVSVSTAGVQGNGDSESASISRDGRFVAFQSAASNLVPNDANGRRDVFVHDRLAGTTERVSVSSTGVEGNQDAGSNPRLSADGRFVLFTSKATNLVSGLNGADQVFVRDRQAGTTSVVSVSSAGILSNSFTYAGAISGDGRFVAFSTNATNLAPGDSSTFSDAFVRDRLLGTTEWVSLNSFGEPGNGHSFADGLSDDGRYVLLRSNSTNLGPGLVTNDHHVFLRDRTNGTTERISLSTSGVPGDRPDFGFSMSANGRFVAFDSESSTLVEGVKRGGTFVRDLDAHCLQVNGYCRAKVNGLGCVPTISTSSVPSAGGSDAFFVTAINVLNQEAGQLLWSFTPENVPFRGGRLCVGAPIVRTELQNSGGRPLPTRDCSGTYSFHFSQQLMDALGLVPGVALFAQYMARDPLLPAPDDVQLSSGVQFTVCP